MNTETSSKENSSNKRLAYLDLKKKIRFTEEQIIKILRERDAGAKVAELCRQHGMRSATLYKWKSKFGDLEVSDAKRLRALKAENSKLKQLVQV